MKMHTKLLMLLATMALGVAPAVAVAAGPGDHPTGPPTNHSTTHTHKTRGAHPGQGAEANAYGKLCQGQSKKHVAGTPGTPFSTCVTDMARLAKGSSTSPRTVCKDESKKHTAGTAGTPFSHCVSSGAKLIKNQHTAR